MGQIILDSANDLIQGDFDNATLNNRTKFRTTTTNATTNVYVVPNGTSTSAGVSVSNNSNLTNASKIVMATNGTTDTQIISGINGSGTYLPLSFYTNDALAMQITTGGIISAVGGGIRFPATQIPSADANTLDDYEEGTFTPNYGTAGTAPSLTYSARNGYYVRIGKMVYISLNVEAATVSSQGTGNFNITGLPFTASNLNSSSNSSVAVGYAASWASSQTPTNAMVFQGSTLIRPYYMSTLGGNKIDNTSSGLANNTSVWMAGCYYTDS